MKLTRNQVINILKDHGIEPKQLTAKKDGQWVEHTCFDEEIGVKPEYSKNEVYAWLGY